MTEHEHGEPEGSPYDHNKPITCPACKTMLAASLRSAYDKACNKYGTRYDERDIADLLAKYES